VSSTTKGCSRALFMFYLLLSQEPNKLPSVNGVKGHYKVLWQKLWVCELITGEGIKI
jgi:hypothetical protein